MNKSILAQYIQDYKRDFSTINPNEIYKWKAIKCFQSEWNPNAENFHLMLVAAFKQTANLISSGNYFPFAMLLHYAEKEPLKTKNILLDLFNEEEDLYERIKNYKNETNKIHKEHFLKAKNTFQDDRAVLVYLTLKYPDRYYFYKFKMFKMASERLLIDYRPQKGNIENIGYYNALCLQVKHEISKDQELVELHKKRLTSDCYFDGSLNILTQDFIYYISSSIFIEKINDNSHLTQSGNTQKVKSSNVNTKTDNISFKGKVINFVQNNIENKRIGDLGELWVIKYEKEKLINLKLNHLVDKISHTAIKEGDGTGYDIKSFDENKNEIFIEVKTTTGGVNNPFYITRNELEKSKIEKDNYYLYRVYNYNEASNQANLLIIKGELSNLCEIPYTYKICLIDSN